MDGTHIFDTVYDTDKSFLLYNFLKVFIEQKRRRDEKERDGEGGDGGEKEEGRRKFK